MREIVKDINVPNKNEFACGGRRGDSMAELEPCPFCGGAGKVSFKDYRFIGVNGFGDKKIQYRVQVICNRCRSRGKPIITDGLINPNPYATEWGNNGMPTTEKMLRQQSMFAPYVVKAIEAWNHRERDSKQNDG